VSCEFEDSINNTIEKEVERRLKDSFIEDIAGDWEIEGLLERLRVKYGSKDFDLLVFYLFNEIISDRGVNVSCNIYNDEGDVIESDTVELNKKLSTVDKTADMIGYDATFYADDMDITFSVKE
jgi:hypothetical protein